MIPTDEALRQTLQQVIDPELGINIVDLGLVYVATCRSRRARVEMTMTTPACPMGGFLEEEARRVLQTRFPELGGVEVRLVFEPPWAPSMMTEAAKSSLGWQSP